MFSYQFKTTLVLLFLGFFCGVCMSVLFMGCGGCNRGKLQPSTFHEIKKKQNSADSTFQKEKERLDTIKQQLKSDAKATKTALQKAKQTTGLRQQQIKRLTEPKGYPAQLLLEKRTRPEPDTVFDHCDSLVQEVAHFIEENQTKDSLYENQIGTLDSLVFTQDAIIQNNSAAYNNLQRLFNQAVDFGETVEKENLRLHQKLRRQKTKSKIVSIGLMILTGAATNYLIHR
jgi:hypothetical protein